MRQPAATNARATPRPMVPMPTMPAAAIWLGHAEIRADRKLVQSETEATAGVVKAAKVQVN